LGGSQGQRNASQAARLLPVQLHPAVCEDAADVDDTGTAIEVASFERQPLGAAQPRQADEEGNGGEGGGKFVPDRLEILERLERGNLSPLRLRVGDKGSGVLVEKLRPDRVTEQLPQRLVRFTGRRRAPGAARGRGGTVLAPCTRGAAGLPRFTLGGGRSRMNSHRTASSSCGRPKAGTNAHSDCCLGSLRTE
jgi:hypothetical protein